MNQIKSSLSLLFFLAYGILTISCGRLSTRDTVNEISQNLSNSTGTASPLPVGPVVEIPSKNPVQPAPNPTLTHNSFKPQICSDLSFSNVSWPKGTNQQTATLFALAMNITGSFEGHEGWSNIANNFDGQGLSLGLFNQNFGQGTLQPLMIQFRTTAQTTMRKVFSASQMASLEKMLVAWNGESLPLSFTKAQPAPSLNFYKDKISELDDPSLLEPSDIVQFQQQKASSDRNQKSVDWAVAHLYNGSSFRSEWKNSLQDMSLVPEYVSLQLQAAKYIHNKAVGYMNKYNFKEIRSYFFFFDIVVQNGSLTSGVESKYANWVKTNPQASETTKLNKILEYRLQLVRSQYVNDVRLRKMAVIQGTGTVHGSRRDFRKEYCGPSWSTLFTEKTTLN